MYLWIQAGENLVGTEPPRRVIIDQSDMYTNVFAVFEDNRVSNDNNFRTACVTCLNLFIYTGNTLLTPENLTDG